MSGEACSALATSHLFAFPFRPVTLFNFNVVPTQAVVYPHNPNDGVAALVRTPCSSDARVPLSHIAGPHPAVLCAHGCVRVRVARGARRGAGRTRCAPCCPPSGRLAFPRRLHKPPLPLPRRTSGPPRGPLPPSGTWLAYVGACVRGCASVAVCRWVGWGTAASDFHVTLAETSHAHPRPPPPSPLPQLCAKLGRPVVQPRPRPTCTLSHLEPGRRRREGRADTGAACEVRAHQISGTPIPFPQEPVRAPPATPLPTEGRLGLA
jgi:hypothetical protein